MKVLIADDDPIPRRMLEATLKKWGYQVVVTRDGEEAWQALQGEDSPHLAILDWQMPGIEGAEVCRKVRERTDTPYVYMLLLTSKDRKQDIIEGMEAGADDYLTKPFDPHELEVRLRAGQRILDLEAALLASLSEVKRAEEELARARKREGEIGGRIQQTLLLGQPPQAHSGLRVVALTIPSQHIDGDFYDFFEHNEHCLDVIVGDVMGKGVPAALLGAALKSHFLRAMSHLAASRDRDRLPEPEEIVTLVHSEVTRQFIGLERFATLCYARFDLQQHRITFVDCGHTKTIHYRCRTGVCEKLEGESMPLGFSEREIYPQVSKSFDPGDLFFFYSDGLTEATNAAGELFGAERLTSFVEARGRMDPQVLVDRIRSEIISYANSDTFADDLTCVAVKIEDDSSGVSEAAAVSAREELEVSSDLTQLPAIRAFVRRFCEAIPPPALDADSIAQVELAITEACSNIIKHAYHGRTDQSIQIKAELLPDRVSLSLYHSGESFDPSAVRPPSFDGSREGGFGVYIIAQSMDEVCYARDERGMNCISLVKHRNNRGAVSEHGYEH